MTTSSLLVGQSTILTTTLYQDGDATDLGTVTIGIVDANGDTVVSPGTSVTDNSDGTYEYSLAKQTEPTFLINTWSVSGGSDFTTYLDVQGSQLFNEFQLRNYDDGAIDAATYADDAVAKTHQRVAEWLEAQTGRSHIRRYQRVVLPGNGSRFLDLNHGHGQTAAGLPLIRPGSGEDVIQIISADDGASVTTSNIIIHPSGLLQRTDDAWTQATSDNPRNVTIEYEYGIPYPMDGADRIAMMIARHQLVSSRIPSNAASFTDALGTYEMDDNRLPFEAWAWVRDHKTFGYFA